MSSSKPKTIKDVDTDIILDQVKDMRREIQKSKNGTGKLIISEQYFQKNYPYLFERFPSLFQMVFEDKIDYLPVVENMLNGVSCIQNGSYTQFNADKKIGEFLAEKYIYPNIDMDKERNTKKKG